MERQKARAILSVSVLFLTATAPVRSQDVSALNTGLEQARPEVERVLGYPLLRVRLEENRQPTAPASRDVEIHLRLRFPHLNQTTYPQACDDALAVNEQAALAQHVEGTATIRVQPHNAARMPRWHNSLQAADSPDLVKLAVLHEVVRCALEVRYDLAKRREACRDAEEWFALQALVEGRAQWVTRQVAGRLKMDAVFPLLAQRLLYVPDISPDPALRTMSQSAQRQKFWAYTQGLTFWTALENETGMDEAKTFARPPRQTKWIEQPALYLRAARAGRADLATALAAVESALPAAEWTVQPQAWTPAMFVQVAGLLGERGRAEKIVQDWDEARSLVWLRKSDAACVVALSVVRFGSASGARAYHGLAIDLQRKRDALSNTPGGLPLPIAESRTTVVSLPGMEQAVLFAKRMEQPNGRQTIWAHTLLARQAACAVEITWHGAAADLTWAQTVLRGVVAP